MKDGIINLYYFQNGKVGAEIQSLEAHTDQVFCLYCMKTTQSFGSGSADKSIIIWSLDKINIWKVQQTLNVHEYYVTCIIMNSREDLLISRSNDFTVKFCEKLYNYWNLSDSVYGNGQIYCLRE